MTKNEIKTRWNSTRCSLGFNLGWRESLASGNDPFPDIIGTDKRSARGHIHAASRTHPAQIAPLALCHMHGERKVHGIPGSGFAEIYGQIMEDAVITPEHSSDLI